MSGPLDLEMVSIHSMWVLEPKPGHLQKQQMLLPTETSLQLLLKTIFIKLSCLKQSTELNGTGKRALRNEQFRWVHAHTPSIRPKLYPVCYEVVCTQGLI